MKKILILRGAFEMAVNSLFRDRAFKVVGSLKDSPDAVVWTGGADINPELYGEEPHKTTWFSKRTDDIDLSVYDAVSKELPKIGICRGAQLLNVKAGGKLWQDVDRHVSTHKATDVETGRILNVSSCHHQMQRPGPLGRVLTVAKQSTYREAFDEAQQRSEDDYEDIESVYYPNINALCYQPHPEIDAKEGRDYFFAQVNKYLGI